MARLGVAAALAIGTAFAASVMLGCSAASNEEGGNPKFDAAPPNGGDDAGSCSAAEDAGTSDTWSSLYLDYFGPTGKASCAGTGVCHGDTTQAGYKASGYVCGGTADECYTGITASAAGLLTPISDPTGTELYAVLRKCSTGTGTMPQSPASVYFTTGDMARIAAWIQAGAPND